jgi:hypothetical protein
MGNYLKEFGGLPFPPTREAVKKDPGAASDYLVLLQAAVSNYLSELFSVLGNDVVVVKSRLAVGKDSPSCPLDVEGQGAFSDHVSIPAGKKILLEGATGDSYITFDSGTARINFYINGTIHGYLDVTTGWVSV